MEGKLLFLYDTETDHHLVAVPLPYNLILVIHEDTLVTYDTREWNPDRYHHVKPLWPEYELKSKLFDWTARHNNILEHGRFAIRMQPRPGTKLT